MIAYIADTKKCDELFETLKGKEIFGIKRSLDLDDEGTGRYVV